MHLDEAAGAIFRKLRGEEQVNNQSSSSNVGKVVNTTSTTTALIVDDNPENRLIFNVCLRNAGYKTFQAADGKEALKILEENPSIQYMILDLQMPIMNGVEVLEYIIQQPQYNTLYIIVVTANTHMVRVGAVQQRANDVMFKPINIPEFTLFVTRLRER